MLTTDDVGDGRTVVHQVPGSSASQTPTNCQTELELNSFGNVESVQVVMKKTFQTTVELPSAGDETCCGIQHTLEFVCDVPRRSG